jgi:MYXO-CTERM domain-containing protein
VNTTALYFQMGDDWNAGVRSLSFQTAAVATTPIPAALPLFVSALGMLGFAARRRRGKAA